MFSQLSPKLLGFLLVAGTLGLDGGRHAGQLHRLSLVTDLQIRQFGFQRRDLHRRFIDHGLQVFHRLGRIGQLTFGLGARYKLSDLFAASLQVEGIYTQYLDHLYLFDRIGVFSSANIDMEID